MNITLKTQHVAERKEKTEEWTSESIKKCWNDETAETCLVLALLERAEATEQKLNTTRTALAKYINHIGVMEGITYVADAPNLWSTSMTQEEHNEIEKANTVSRMLNN